jgi:RNA polymerase sigma-B factor
MASAVPVITSDVDVVPAIRSSCGLPGGRSGRRPDAVETTIVGTAGRTRTGAPAGYPVGGVRVEELLQRRARLPVGDPRRAELRACAIEAALPMARRLAARYRGRGEPLDDLRQVAALALVKAVDGYEPGREAAFSSYARPTILGALRRHFRDTTWRVRVTRGIQELAITLAPATADLAQQLGRWPTLPELAGRLDAAEADVATAIDAWQAHHPDSLDAPATTSEGRQRPVVETIGAVDARFDTVTDLHSLRPLLAALPVRQRRILALRYLGDMTQAEIAVEVGVSQMQVSRLLARVLSELRAAMLAE